MIRRIVAMAAMLSIAASVNPAHAQNVLKRQPIAAGKLKIKVPSLQRVPPRVLFQRYVVTYRSSVKRRCFSGPKAGKAFSMASRVRQLGGRAFIRCFARWIRTGPPTRSNGHVSRRLVRVCCVHYYFRPRSKIVNSRLAAIILVSELRRMGVSASMRPLR